MKSIFKNISNELNKSILSYGFIICSILTFLLCFTSVIYTDSSGKEYSVFEIITNKNEFYNIILSLDNEYILKESINNYHTIFLPILSSLPFVTVFCSERISGYIRFNVYRCKRINYYISKFISAIISSGLSVMLGYILYSIIIFILLPSKTNNINTIIILYIGVAIYGAISILPAFFISSFIKNKFIICCLPFVILHFYYTFLTKIQNYFINKENWDAIETMTFLYPNNIRNILFEGKYNILILIYYGSLLLISFIGFVFIMNKRIDYGE